ncbi:MAG: FtsX-like permease family protein, partial [Bacteroidota bacterium]
EIIGVVKDFHYGSLHHKVEPLILRFRNEGLNTLVKIGGQNQQETLEKIKHTFDGFYPDNMFEYTLLDAEYRSLYKAESRLASLSRYFAALAILISCLGLLGLSIFTTEQRKKEIGVRKVLGASVLNIISLLTTDFSKTVGIAILIALPLSYVIVREWLQNFAYQIELSFWLFLIPAFLVLLLAWTTVSLQTFSAASLRPVDSLRDE